MFIVSTVDIYRPSVNETEHWDCLHKVSI